MPSGIYGEKYAKYARKYKWPSWIVYDMNYRQKQQ